MAIPRPRRELLGDSSTEAGYDWRAGAACRDTATRVFYPERGQTAREAKRICAACSVRAECGEDALARREQWGVWGGLDEADRRAVLRAERAAS